MKTLPSIPIPHAPLRVPALLATAMAALVITLPAQAADKIWNNGTANSIWDSSSLNWTGSAWTAGDAAIFDATGAGPITVSGTQTVGNMTFSAGGYSFSGGTLQFNGATNTIATGTNDVTITSAISFLAGGGLDKTGTGKLTLNSDITYAGTGQTISNNGGILEIASGNIHLTDVRLRGFTSSGSLDITGGTILLDGTATNRGLVTGNAGRINITGGNVTTNQVLIGYGSTGTLTIGGSANVTLSGTNTILQVGNGGNTATATLNLDGGTLNAYRIVSTFTSGNTSGVAIINLNGTMIKATADHLNWISPFNDAGNNSSTSRINVLAGGAIFDSNGHNVRIFRNLTGSDGDGGITKLGAGIVYLTGTNNTVQGDTTVQAGTLLVGNISNSATGTGNVFVKNGATFGGRGIITGSVTAEAGSTLLAGGISGENFSTVAVGTLTTGSQIWQGGAGLQLELSTDGSTGAAGTEWDHYALNGTLDLSALSAGDPFTVSLFTMSDAVTRGLLATWDGSSDALWASIVTTTSGVTGFSADKFSFDSDGFGNSFGGTFSLVLNGNNLDLVYTAAAIPEPASAGLIVLSGALAFFAARRKRRTV